MSIFDEDEEEENYDDYVLFRHYSTTASNW